MKNIALKFFKKRRFLTKFTFNMKIVIHKVM